MSRILTDELILGRLRRLQAEIDALKGIVPSQTTINNYTEETRTVRRSSPVVVEEEEPALVEDERIPTDLGPINDRLDKLAALIGRGGPGGASQAQLDALQAKVDGATIEAHCNGDGTISVTLTWGP